MSRGRCPSKVCSTLAVSKSPPSIVNTCPGCGACRAPAAGEPQFFSASRAAAGPSAQVGNQPVGLWQQIASTTIGPNPASMTLPHTAHAPARLAVRWETAARDQAMPAGQGSMLTVWPFQYFTVQGTQGMGAPPGRALSHKNLPFQRRMLRRRCWHARRAASRPPVSWCRGKARAAGGLYHPGHSRCAPRCLGTRRSRSRCRPAAVGAGTMSAPGGGVPRRQGERAGCCSGGSVAHQGDGCQEDPCLAEETSSHAHRRTRALQSQVAGSRGRGPAGTPAAALPHHRQHGISWRDRCPPLENPRLAGEAQAAWAMFPRAAAGRLALSGSGPPYVCPSRAPQTSCPRRSGSRQSRPSQTAGSTSCPTPTGAAVARSARGHHLAPLRAQPRVLAEPTAEPGLQAQGKAGCACTEACCELRCLSVTTTSA